MLKEFKEFAMRGNVIDLAVGVIIGAAFGRIVDSVVNDLVMPLVGKIIGNVVNFVILAFIIFLLVRGMNSVIRRKIAAPFVPPPPTKEELLLTEMRDILKEIAVK